MTFRSVLISLGVALLVGCGSDDKQKEPPTNGNAIYCVDEMFPDLAGNPVFQPICYGCKPPCRLVQSAVQSAPQILVIPLGAVLGDGDDAEAIPGVIPRGGLDKPDASCKQCPPGGVKGKLIRRLARPGVPAMNILVLL